MRLYVGKKLLTEKTSELLLLEISDYAEVSKEEAKDIIYFGKISRVSSPPDYYDQSKGVAMAIEKTHLQIDTLVGRFDLIPDDKGVVYTEYVG